MVHSPIDIATASKTQPKDRSFHRPSGQWVQMCLECMYDTRVSMHANDRNKVSAMHCYEKVSFISEWNTRLSRKIICAAYLRREENWLNGNMWICERGGKHALKQHHDNGQLIGRIRYVGSEQRKKKDKLNGREGRHGISPWRWKRPYLNSGRERWIPSNQRMY